jgi:hypothetical protein
MPFDEQLNRTVYLFGFDLYSKWGFSDGDVNEEVCSELGLRRWRHEILIEMVRARLLPALPNKIEVYEISTHHNPIRAEDGYDWNQENADVSVHFTWGEIRQLAMEKGFLWAPA